MAQGGFVKAAVAVAAVLIILAVLHRGKLPQQQQHALQAQTGDDSGDGVLQRFRWALALIERTQGFGVHQQWMCPKELQLGGRPEHHTPDIMGTPCEPWIARGAITMLQELLLPGTAKALEWSSGSSTVWLLQGRVRHLTSIEHHAGWVTKLEETMDKIFGSAYLKDHWQLHHIPSNPAVSEQMEDPVVFADYKAAAFLDDSHLGTFDFISIDGRARAYCFERALQLLKPHGGVLLLDNAERPYYQSGIDSVPRHWLRYDATNVEDTTILWVSCREGSC